MDEQQFRVGDIVRRARNKVGVFANDDSNYLVDQVSQGCHRIHLASGKLPGSGTWWIAANFHLVDRPDPAPAVDGGWWDLDWKEIVLSSASAENLTGVDYHTADTVATLGLEVRVQARRAPGADR